MKAYLWFWGAFLLFFALPFPASSMSARRGRCNWPTAAHPGWPCCCSRCRWPCGWPAARLPALPAAWPAACLHRVRSILADGEARDALIEQAEQTGVHVRGFAQWKLQLGFQNLSGTPTTNRCWWWTASRTCSVRCRPAYRGTPEPDAGRVPQTWCWRVPSLNWMSPASGVVCRRSDRHRGGGQCLCGRLSAAE